MTETGKCAICGEDYAHWGNNPAPLLKYEDRVCDQCNEQVVIPVRLGLIAPASKDIEAK